MHDFFHKVQHQIDRKLPFVIYNKPKSDRLVGFFQKNDELYFAQDFNEPGFVFAPFDGNDVVLIPKNQSEIISIDWIEGETNPQFHYPENHDGQADFESLVRKGISAIDDGQFQKVVLSRKEQVLVDNFDAIATFKNLINTYPTAFTYCFFHPKTGMWFGASPEQLLKVKTNQFETMALAGTQKFEGNDNVIWENKEKEEQQFVTDFIMENLENVTNDIAFSSPYTYKAGNLLHLKTDISGTLSEGSNVRHLLDILHPTPAVCGLPKEKARLFIAENEGYDRKYYSGYLGELHADFHSEDSITDLFVNLRCMEIDGNSAYLYIGCGVTKDSDPKKEFIETVNKAMTIKKIL
jgi:isochorismate synthase